MSYRVRIDAFEGPFDLLLRLVTTQKLDIGAISIADIADQYLAEIERMRDLDLDVASDFLVVAATLLEIKASSLIEAQQPDERDDDELAQLDPEATRDVLVERLIVYKQFKNAAAALAARMESEGRMHARQAGLEPQFIGLVPDYLEGVTLHNLAVTCADIASRRDVFLLEAEHIAAVPISMERHLESIYHGMRQKRHVSFAELVGPDASAELIVVSLLAVLELYKRGVVSLAQEQACGDIVLDLECDAPEITDFSVPDWGMPDEQDADGQPAAGDTADGVPDGGRRAQAGEDASRAAQTTDEG